MIKYIIIIRHDYVRYQNLKRIWSLMKYQNVLNNTYSIAIKKVSFVDYCMGNNVLLIRKETHKK